MLRSAPGMRSAIQGLLASKKAMMAFLSSFVWLVGRLGLDLDPDVLAGVVAPLWVYIFGQGFADLGKGREDLAQSGLRAANSQPTRAVTKTAHSP